MTEALRYGKPSGKTVKYLEKYFTSPFRTGYVTCGETVLPEKFTRFGDLIREMNIRSDDTWVFSFPRTGKYEREVSFLILSPSFHTS